MKILDKKISELVFAEYNPRQLSKEQFQQIKDSIARFGIVDPIIVNSNKDRKNIIIGGHQRVKVALEMGIDTLPCHYVNITRDKERELNIRLNKNTGEWDWQILAEAFDVDELIEWGFSEDELDFPDPPAVEGLTDEDAVPEVVEPITKLGDLWLLGNHRLLCGDATISTDVDRLMDGDKADMVFTDPPYGMDAVKNSGVLKSRYNDIIGDDTIDTAVDSFNLLFGGVGVVDFPSMVWWGANYYCRALPHESHWIVWDKNNGGSDQMDCELAWSNLPGVTRMFKQASEKKDRVHPTQKPVALVEWCLDTPNPSTVIDPFLGSGSTLIACEKTNRKCYGMELDPHYCDVIVKRWEEFTGKKAELAN